MLLYFQRTQYHLDKMYHNVEVVRWWRFFQRTEGSCECVSAMYFHDNPTTY
ncbi:MAG: hypothetical protein BECKG1743D_GA0114223_103532 [Candidatus Kentron sp. G]|nr:MAG: hypothetical protein BECKG1743D_GA0114223_103532 [Candidatus Kentron sp. G]VFN05117.1 MAG: hypothetical protein BECKG1743F_GA0114225_110281 [Candidatus Kentron sp. G]VFN05309.1 MAG: hypothetical protein BECKG1743E_GA0114224_108482 [Candidatus Kentron sp. G]